LGPAGPAIAPALFQGRWSLIYFGWAFSPVATPAALQTMVTVADDLRDSVVPILITVDPTRDTVSALADYARQFSPNLIGLTGNMDQIKIAERTLRVEAPLFPAKGKDDSLENKNSSMYLIGPDGRLRGVLPATDNADGLGARITAIMIQQEPR